MFVEKCNKLVVETTVPGNLQSMAVSGSLSVWVSNRGGDMALLSSAEWFNKPHFVTLDRTSPSVQTDSAGGLKPSLNNAQKKYCMVCNSTSFPKKLMSFISVAHRLIFCVCAGLIHLINPAACCAIIVNPGDQCISFPFNNS